MNRNVTIVVIILVLAVMAAYLVWLRGQYQEQFTPLPPQLEQTPPPSASPEATSSTTEKIESSPSAKPKTATPSSTE